MKKFVERQSNVGNVLANIRSLMKEQIKITQTDDFKEGVKAFLDKKKPKWKG
jgi:enoyl-CoA hydratase/carnithine racemase